MDQPLFLLAPKQATFQLERQLLADESLAGYTRLHILSFERLAHFIFDHLRKPAPKVLDEDGRLMVLRGLLSRKHDVLKLFRGSARLSGFANQLSGALREFQQAGFTPESVEALSTNVNDEGLSLKLQDLALLYRSYLEWLRAHHVQDTDCLLSAAAGALNESDSVLAALHPEPYENKRTAETVSETSLSGRAVLFGGLWLDGFAELSAQEIELLTAVVSRCERSTLAFCLDQQAENVSWLSHWSGVLGTFEQCKARLGKLAGAAVFCESLPRDPLKSRFANSPVLRHLEAHWAEPTPFAEETSQAIRVVLCRNPEAEATFAAREILRFVRAGGRYRDVAVIVRKLDSYHSALERVFSKYEIPFFLDRRESMSHHPLVELTRSALRTVAFQWQHDDWFASLKTGLLPAEDAEIDWLENEALARGWRGGAWLQPIHSADQPELAARLETVRRRVVPPFQRLALNSGGPSQKPSGLALADALEMFWEELNVCQRLQDWAAEKVSDWNPRLPGSVHLTVWEQMTRWLENLKLAFAHETMTLREWLPVLEAGLANLTVGVIPPALDQVLIGAIDRSRNPDIKFAIVLGVNEGVFPARPEVIGLLTETDRVELEKRNYFPDTSMRRQLRQERYFAYIACTRARERVILTCSTLDERGNPLNTSSILWQLRQLFPSMYLEELPGQIDWHEAEHASELIVPALEAYSAGNETDKERILSVPGLASVITAVTQFKTHVAENISPVLAERLYGSTLRTSVSRIEQFAACPFRFFVHSGLRAEERKRFEVDAREQGSFQHDVLKLFHEQIQKEGKHWRDIAPAEARERIGQIAHALMASYRDGLMQTSAQTRFTAKILAGSLQDFVETIVGWMRQQYQFEPAAVELAFGEDGGIPPWLIDLDQGHCLALHGRIDRVDISYDSTCQKALAVVIDYKSSQKQLDPMLMANGIQLQLLAYLNVVANSEFPADSARGGRVVPVGAFYVNLRGIIERARNRNEALAETGGARNLAYQHCGRFDARFLRKLDSRDGTRQGDQFNYRLNANGRFHGASREAIPTMEFESLLSSVKKNVESMGRQIFSGVVGINPYRKGLATACDLCEYQSICRIDPWTHMFRSLKEPDEES